MAFVSSPTCVFCGGENRASTSTSGLRSVFDAHRDPPGEAMCIDDQCLQASSLYGSLDPLATWQIRVLELLDSPNSAPLAGRLFNADMLSDGGVVESGTKDRRLYIAVSYYWGDDKTSKYYLQCNGTNYPIPLEAYRALHRIRDCLSPVYLWIDTVCINQHDDSEKSSQVAKMRRIYQNAKRVVVYLGEHTRPEQAPPGRVRSPTEFVVDLLGDYDISRRFPGLTSPTMSDQIRRSRNFGHTFCDEHADLLEQGVREIAGLKWFDRIWIKQEIWAAASVEIRLGHSILQWQTLQSLQECFDIVFPQLSTSQQKTLKPSLEKLSIKIERLTIGTPIVHAAANMDDKPNPGLVDDEANQHDIVNVIRRAVGADCSRVHDRIFGLLGMTSVNVERIDDDRQNCFLVSYTEHPSETFSQLAKYIICRDHSLNVLFLDSAFPRPHHAGVIEGQVLPSWVPDWRCDIGSVHIAAHPLESWLKRTWTLPMQDTFRILHVKGFFLGSVASRLKRPNMVAEVHWTHCRLQHSAAECAVMPTGARRFDRVVLFEGASAVVLLRPRMDHPTYFYVAPIFPLKGSGPTIDHLRPDFNAVIKFMSLFSIQSGTPVECESIELA